MPLERKGLDQDLAPAPQERDPMRVAQARPELPKRFYKKAEAGPFEGGFGVFLDGKPVKTPARKPLLLPSAALAGAVAAEWAGQGERIDPSAMPLTRLINSAIDGVAARRAEVEADVVKYAASDLLCYRAGEPEGLARAQSQAWDPLIAVARDVYSARFALAEGVSFVEQPPAALDAIARAVRAYVAEGPGAHIRLAALHAMTTLTGSSLIALAVANRHVDVETAWTAAHVDEDFQMSVWGVDAEAQARRARRFAEMQAAAVASQA